MINSDDLIKKRKEAYEYIKQTIITRMYFPKNSTNVKLADRLGGTVGIKSALDGLQSGKTDPTPKLVDAFKGLFLPLIPESTINSYLVDSFKK
jgi:hypothetical protein